MADAARDGSDVEPSSQTMAPFSDNNHHVHEQQQQQQQQQQEQQQQKQPGPFGLEHLPAFVLSNILAMTAWSDVEEVRGTCRTLRDICDTQLCEVSARLAISSSAWTRIKAVAPRLKALTLHDCKTVPETSIAEVIQICANLETLRLTNAALADSVMSALLQAAPPLQVLELSGSIACTEDQCVDLVRCFRNTLRSLYLGNALGAGRRACAEIMRSCEALESLELFECPLLNAFELFHGRALKLLSLRSCRLERLCVRDSAQVQDYPQPPDAACCKDHEEEEEEEEDHVGKELAAGAFADDARLTSDPPCVEALDLRFNPWLDFTQVKRFANCLPCLRKLWLAGSCSPIGVRNELDLCDLYALEEVDLEACASLTRLTIERCPQLKDLNVGACDQLVSVEITSADHLKNLELQLLENLKSVRLCDMPRLRFVNLCGCYSLDAATNVHMEKVPKSCVVIKADRFAHLLS